MHFPILLAIAVSTLVKGQSFDPNKAGPQSWDPAAVGTNTTVITYEFFLPLMLRSRREPPSKYHCERPMIIH